MEAGNKPIEELFMSGNVVVSLDKVVISVDGNVAHITAVS